MTSVTDVVVIGAGQSGLTAARSLQEHGISPVVLEAGPEPAGSWPRYYDSLTLFSPARYSDMPGLNFPGDPDHYPHRDEVAAYLRRYAASLGADIRTNTPVTAVEAHGQGRFLVHTASGQTIHAAGVVAATGSFGNPYLPALPGQGRFAGRLLHVAGYSSPHQHAGERVIVVGGGNSAVQVGYELAQVATVTLATRHPVNFHPQRRGGQDLHHWLVTSGFDLLPPQWLDHYLGDRWVVDTGKYRHALDTGLMDSRPMFTGFGADDVIWPDGTREKVDTVVLATGYRPHLDYLSPLGALDNDGMPLHTGGISATHPGLVYLGLEFQRSFSSNTLRGVHRDAEHAISPLAAHVRNAPAAVGLSALTPASQPQAGAPTAGVSVPGQACQDQEVAARRGARRSTRRLSSASAASKLAGSPAGTGSPCQGISEGSALSLAAHRTPLADGPISQEQLYFPGPMPSIADLATLAGDANGTAIHFDAGSIRYRWLDRQRRA